MGKGRREGGERGWGGDVRERGRVGRGRVGERDGGGEREGGERGRVGREVGEGREGRDDGYTYYNRYVH